MMKRTICVLLTVALVLGMAVIPASAGAVLYGDIDSNGKINNRDLGRLQQHLGDWEVDIDLIAADVDDNGKVNNRDLGRLQQYLGDWDVQLGPDEPVFPQVELPENSYDLDGKGRIFAETITQDGNTVSVLFVNKHNRWISEETSYVKYICTDAEGNVLTLDNKYYGFLYFGMLEVGDSVVKTFTLPEGTVQVEFGECYINYWTQWA